VPRWVSASQFHSSVLNINFDIWICFFAFQEDCCKSMHLLLSWNTEKIHAKNLEHQYIYFCCIIFSTICIVHVQWNNRLEIGMIHYHDSERNKFLFFTASCCILIGLTKMLANGACFLILVELMTINHYCLNFLFIIDI
jgi:hypothetical protein